jgi:ABC-2 type transport system ATP-binding protein
MTASPSSQARRRRSTNSPVPRASTTTSLRTVVEVTGAGGDLRSMASTNTLDRSLDVRENLEFHARYFGTDGRKARAAADRMLEVMRLTEKASAEVGTLSGGMAQRLMVARGWGSSRFPGCAGVCS